MILAIQDVHRYSNFKRLFHCSLENNQCCGQPDALLPKAESTKLSTALSGNSFDYTITLNNHEITVLLPNKAINTILLAKKC